MGAGNHLIEILAIKNLSETVQNTVKITIDLIQEKKDTTIRDGGKVEEILHTNCKGKEMISGHVLREALLLSLTSSSGFSEYLAAALLAVPSTVA